MNLTIFATLLYTCYQPFPLSSCHLTIVENAKNLSMLLKTADAQNYDTTPDTETWLWRALCYQTQISCGNVLGTSEHKIWGLWRKIAQN